MGSLFGIGNFDAIGGGGGGGGDVTRREVERMIEGTLNTAKNEGAFDDTKVYETYQAMITAEPTGRADTLYIVSADDTKYLWSNNEYTPIESTATNADVAGIFES